jgi:hypothetical protein
MAMMNETDAHKGRAVFSLAFVLYGLLLVGMTVSAAMMNVMTENWATPALNTLQHIIPLVYIPAVVLYFARVRLYILCLVAAYAYDLWFQFWSGSLSSAMLVTDYPVWTVLVIFTVAFGLLCRGFRFRWWFHLLRQPGRNTYLSD